MTRRTPLQIFPDMKRQAKLRPQTTSTFGGFSDGASSRLFPVGTVAQQVGYADNTAWKDDAINTGKDGSAFVEVNPMPVTQELLKRGQDRFNIYCQPCHGAQGDGNGITKKYGMGATPTYHDDRIRKMPEGEIYNTITLGKNTMYPYADKLVPADRWAVVAYVRALQRAQTGSTADVPGDHKSELGLK
jgi:mono/diheme cytochrome c family protein